MQKLELRARTAAIRGTRADSMIRLAVYIDSGMTSGMSMKELADVMRMSHATLKRHLACAEDDFGLRIRYARHTGTRSAGSSGDYFVESWGLIDREKARQMIKPRP